MTNENFEKYMGPIRAEHSFDAKCAYTVVEKLALKREADLIRLVDALWAEHVAATTDSPWAWSEAIEETDALLAELVKENEDD